MRVLLILLIPFSLFGQLPMKALHYTENKMLMELLLESKKHSNQKDSNDLKQGIWVLKGKDRPDYGVCDSCIVEIGNYKDDRKEGIWIKFYSDGHTPKLLGYFEYNRPKGLYMKYYSNGYMSERGNFKRNRYADSLFRYHETAYLEYYSIYDSLGKEICYKFFDENGQEIPKSTQVCTRSVDRGIGVSNSTLDTLESIYRKNESFKTIKPTRLSNNFIVKSKKKFDNNGYNEVYYPNQEFWQCGQYKDGQLMDGKEYFYDSDGILLYILIFRNGVFERMGQL